MAIKAGQIIHTGDTVLVQRLQTAGPGNLNIPQNRISELGNYQSVAVTHDTPDLTFSMDSYDVMTSMEALLTRGTAAPYNLNAPLPIDIASQWKAGQDDPAPFQVVESVAIPQLTPESISYRFGLQDNASQTVTLRTDSIFYNPGPTIVEQFVGSGTSGQALALTHPAGVYNGDVVNGPRYALNVMVGSKRLLYGVDYTETTVAGADPNFPTVTVTITNPVASGTRIQIVYFTNDVVSYLQTVHTAPSVKPAAIRGRDITVFVNGVAITDRWVGVQSVSIDERLTIERDMELGSAYATSIDYSDVPTVTGSVAIRARNPADLHSRLVTALGIASSTEAVGPLQFNDVRFDVVLHHPDTGAVLKTLEVADAQFTLPGYSSRVNTKLDVTMNFQSESGVLTALDSAPV